MMEYQYLGTGAAEGMPATFCACPVCLRSMQEGGKSLRTRSCTLLGGKVLIDLSPDIHAQKLRLGLRLDQVRSVVFTHAHPDHEDIYALQMRGVASCSVLPSEQSVLDLYGSLWVKKRFLQACATHERMLEERFVFHEVKPWEPFETQGYTFYPLRANHRPRAVEDCLIYAISDGERAILYANDTGEVADEVIEYLKTTGLCFDVVSMDCARGLLPGDGHMGWNEALALRERLQGAGLVAVDTRYILNHLSHMNDMTHSEWERFAAPHGIEVAWDGMRVCC